MLPEVAYPRIIWQLPPLLLAARPSKRAGIILRNIKRISGLIKLLAIITPISNLAPRH